MKTADPSKKSRHITRQLYSRRKSDNVIKIQHEQFESAFEQAAVGMAHTGVDGKWLRVNNKLCEMLGYSAKELIKQKFQDITHPEDMSISLKALRDLLDNKISQTSIEKRYLKRDGSIIWVKVTTAIIRGADKKPEYFTTVVEDISRRKKAEAERERAIEEANNFFNLPDLMLCIAGTDGYFKRLNPAWEDTLGFSTKELTSKPWIHFVHPDDVKTTVAEGRKLKKGAPTINFQNRYLCKDGSYRWLLWNVRPVGNVLYAAARDITPLKEIQAELGYRTALLEAQNEATLDGVLVVDKDGMVVSYNKRFTEMWNIPKEVIAKRNDKALVDSVFSQLTNPDEFVQRIKYLYARPNKTSHDELNLKDGRIYHRYSVPVKGTKGMNYGRAWYFRDITEQKRTEEILQRNSIVLDSMAEGVSVASEDGTIVYTNPAEDEMFGYKTGELIGQHVTVQNAYPPEENVRLLNDVIKQLKLKGVWFGEWQNRRKDGSTFQTSSRISSIELSGKRYWICVQRDITARKQAEEALKRSEENFRQLADSMPQIIWTARPDGYLDYYNKRWYEYTGFKERYGDQSWRPILHPDDVDFCIKTWYHSVKTGEPYQIEYRFKDRQRPGKYRWFLGRATPIRDDKGNIIKWFGTCTDVDSVKRTMKRQQQLERLTENLRKQRTRLMEVNTAKDEFISIVSHQLRTPASGVKQYLSLLLSGYMGELTPSQAEAVQVAFNSNERQIRIVDDMLKIAQVDSGEVKLVKQKTDLSKLVGHIIDEQRAAFENKHQKISFNKPAGRLSALIDPNLMRMVFENLISNAIKYSPEKAQITVGLKNTDKKQIVFSVKDEGVGIPKKDQSKLFQKFSRIHNPLSVEAGGSGLGLYWSKKIVDLHEGKIMLESKKGKGSLFSIYIPR